MAHCSFAFSSLLALVVAACSPQIRQPELADLSETARAYDAPSGELTRANVEALVRSASSIAERVAASNLHEFVFSVVGALEPDLEARGVIERDQSDQRKRVSIDASVRLRVPCPGPDREAPSTSGEFGRLDLVTRVDDNVLANVLQGTAERCVIPGTPSSGSATTLDGMVYLQTFGANHQVLLVLDGTLGNSTAPDAPLEAFEARFSEEMVETRIRLESTEVIAFVEGETFGLRDSHTRYTCEPLQRSCTGADGSLLPW